MTQAVALARSPPGTWRLLAPALLAWGCVAVAVAVPGAASWMLGSAGALGILMCTLLLCRVVSRQSGVSGILLIACALLVVLGARVSTAEFARSDPMLSDAAESAQMVDVAVRLTGYPETRSDGPRPLHWVRAEVDASRGAVPVLLWLDESPPTAWAPGTQLELSGVVRRLPPGGAAYGIRVADVSVGGDSDAPDPAATLGWAGLRLSLRSAAERVPGAELVPGFAVGDTALVGPELDRRMRESSLGHLTAVSGANCALVTGVVIRALARLGFGRRWRVIAAGCALAGFLLLVGPDPSVQRAAVMAGVLLVSDFGGRRSRALPALGLAMILLLVTDPWQALQPGFGLSVAATGGILLAATPIRHWLGKRLRLPGWLALPVAVALAAQLACGPLLLLLQPGIPAVGVLANVVAGPAAPLGTGLGLLALLLAPWGSGLSSPAHVVLLLAALPARWVAETARLAAELPAGRWFWPEGWPGAALLAACELALLLAWALHRGVASLGGGRRVRPRAPWRWRQRPPPAVRVAVAGCVAGALGVTVGFTLVTPLGRWATTPREWGVVACDVGQGDALLLRDPAQPETVMLVDTGDDPERLQSCLDRFGVSRIALLVLTHDDRDHVAALGEVIDRVDRALIAPTVSGEQTEARAVVRQLRAAGVPLEIGTAGARSEHLSLPETPGPRWRILAPQREAIPVDTNAASLVMLVDAGPIRALLLADTGMEEQAALNIAGEDLRADVLKVAHHGSRDQDHSLPATVRADWALVSVGADNRYGHPTAETLGGLARVGTRTLRTDHSGSIALIPRRLATGEESIVAWVERGRVDAAP